MSSIGFGGKYWSLPSPAYIKVLCYLVVGVAVYLVTNIDGSPLKDGWLKDWLKFTAPVTIPGLIALRDMIGKKSLNESAHEKEV